MDQQGRAQTDAVMCESHRVAKCPGPSTVGNPIRADDVLAWTEMDQPSTLDTLADPEEIMATFSEPGSARSRGSGSHSQGGVSIMGRRSTGSPVLLAERLRRMEPERSMCSNRSLNSDVLELLSFSGLQDLLRGSKLSTVLQGQGRVFSDSAGSSDSYALSRVVKQIDVFISHNWSVPRRDKFWCLALHFNFAAAAALTTVAMLGFLLANALDILPTVEGTSLGRPRGICGTLFCTPIFMLTLGLFHEFRPAEKYAGPGTTVFLDKLCIDQVDAYQQRQGIKKIGAFLLHSTSMCIIYTDIYLQKLWTVYEVASFLSLHPASRMEVVPTFLPRVVFVGLLALYLEGVLSTLLDVAIGRNAAYAYGAVCCVLCYPVMVAFRVWARNQAAIQARLADFDVARCTCSDEADRPLVYRNIAILMRATHVVESGATNQEALEAFNRLVKAQLPGALDGCIGRIGLAYKYALTLGACAFGSSLIDAFAGLPHGLTVREASGIALMEFNSAANVVPLTLIAFAKWARCRQGLAGCRERGFLLAGTLLLLACPVGLRWGQRWMYDWAQDSNVGLIVLGAYTCALSAVTFVVFSGFQGRRCALNMVAAPPVAGPGQGSAAECQLGRVAEASRAAAAGGATKTAPGEGSAAQGLEGELCN